MTMAIEPQMVAGSLVGLAGGLTLLVRGLGGYRTAARIADTPGSTISALAVGETRLTGVVEPAEMLLVSPLQSRPCVWYRSDVREARGRSEATVFAEERAIGFRLRDASGDVRVFPRAARWNVPDTFSGSTGFAGDEPPGLDPRSGPALRPGQPDHDAEVAALLTVHGREESLLTPLQRLGVAVGGRRSYREALIEPGATITILGFVEPFDQLPDPNGADQAENAAGGPTDSDLAIAADLAAARASGTLAPNPETAWGNAAIPGFGIGQPVRPPHLDPAAHPMPLADAETAARTERTFAIAPDALIVAASSDVPLLISAGAPSAAAAREDRRFTVGLLGAILSIGSAVALAVAISGGLPA